MKKLFLLIVTIFASVCCLTACGKTKNNEVNSPATDNTVTEYDRLNSMLKESYSNITVTVKNTFTEEGITLESVYSVNYSESEITVEYSIERFSEPSLENPASGVKIKIEGTAVIKDGKISENEAGITASIAEVPLTFKEEYFKNIDLTGVYIDADVKDVSGFLGTELTCTDMHVNAVFVSYFHDITVTYSTVGHEIEYYYSFNR